MPARTPPTRTSTRTAPRPAGRSRLPLLAGVVVLIVVLVVVAVLASGGGGDDDDGASAPLPTSTSVAAGAGPLPTFGGGGTDPAVGLAAPRLDGVALDGASMSVTPGGTPQLVVFLAHWCPHCQAEVPRLVDWMADGGAEGVQVVAVATGTDATLPNFPPADWLAEEDWPGRVLSDDVAGTAASAYGLRNYPYMVAVAADGTVAARASGELDRSGLEALADAARAGSR